MNLYVPIIIESVVREINIYKPWLETEDFNTSVSQTERSSRPKINKKSMNKFDLKDT